MLTDPYGCMVDLMRCEVVTKIDRDATVVTSDISSTHELVDIKTGSVDNFKDASGDEAEPRCLEISVEETSLLCLPGVLMLDRPTIKSVDAISPLTDI